ncbi:hypothetical protein Ccur_13400 [Cryptobacterium curtum DSM 15641]|uniref:Uncharacterized protein n=2 Tax=Cryptobacterium TaxID=84162 RepID=C7ML69_CRYCD|nr:hypothetical protein [Cryptobacterium curtum]ACU95016.1 hypothetical protein Ccur_13400 [Cryptobacterium curtum DSM 15641]
MSEQPSLDKTTDQTSDMAANQMIDKTADQMVAQSRHNPPFHSLTFMMFKQPGGRSVFRMKEDGSGMYKLNVETGSSANGTHFTRTLPQASAQQLKDDLSAAGVFGWDEQYDLDADFKWTLNVVFKEGVYSQSSQGGSKVPPGFDEMLEAFYRLDFPRPDANETNQRGTASFGSASLPFQFDKSTSFDFSSLSGMVDLDGIDQSALAEMQQAFATLQSDPARFQQMMRSEFAAMSAESQEGLLDMLASIGVASRAWWERFLRGNGAE